jgi:uncharacterized protein (DUF2141 family)
MNRIRLLAAALALTAVSPALAQSAPATLSLSFANVAEAKGTIMIAIYDEAGWKGGAPVRLAMLAVKSGATLDIAGLAPGRYAAKVFHDVDGDGTLGMNPFGTPVEPFGFSRDAFGDRGAPAFAAASFEIVAGANAQTITLR